MTVYINTLNNKASRMATVFARQLMRHDKSLTLSEAMWYAWDEIKKFSHNYRVIRFMKKCGKIVQRIVMSSHVTNYVTFKGTGRRLKPGQVIFADAARMQCGCGNIVVSTYESLMYND